MIVLDSSAATDYLVPFEAGDWVADVIAADGDLHAPHALDVEILHALRSLVRARRVNATNAEDVLLALGVLDVARYSHVPLLPRAWSLRERFTGYDAVFVALAETLEATLVTTDRRLARAAGRHVEVLFA